MNVKRWWVLGITATALVLGFGAGAIRTGEGSAMEMDGQQLDGTWLISVTLDSAPPGVPLTITTLNTFMADGALIEGGMPAPPRRTPIGHGQWRRAGDRLFTATFTFLLFDDQGRQTGMQQITRSIRLSDDRQTFRAVSRNEQFDMDGNVVFSGGAIETARRLAIGSPPPAP